MKDPLSNDECREQTVNDLWNVLASMSKLERTMDGSAGLQGKMIQVARSIQILGGVRDVNLGRLESLQHFLKFALTRVAEAEMDGLKKVVREYVDMLRDATGSQ